MANQQDASPLEHDANPPDRKQGDGSYQVLLQRSPEVNYGRLVNVLAALSERVERENRTVTEVQTRLILKRLRDGPEGDGTASEAAYGLDALARVSSNVLGLARDDLSSKILDIVEPEPPPEPPAGDG